MLNQTKKERERIDKLNTADSLVFQTEKQLKEFGDKIPADKKGAIESALEDLKEAHKVQDINRIDAATERLNTAWQAASQDMYQASQGTDQGQTGGNGQQNTGNQGDNTEDVTDADYEEVK